MDLSAELRLQAKQHSQEQVDQQQVVMPPAPPTEETNTSS